MAFQINYLTLEQILVIHQDQIEQYGGSHGLRDLALLESAVFRPQSSFSGKELYKTIFDKTAAIMHSLILNHPFIDGNKRTGIVSAVVFLELNGFRLEVSQKELVKTALKIESKELSLENVAEWLKLNSKILSFGRG